MTQRRIYLDNAATSWPKPEGVYEAVDRYQREVGAPAGRGTYHEAGEAERLVADARRRTAELLGVDEPRRVIFTANGTDSLNLALHGLLQPGDHVVTSVVEHNSVLRPLRWLEEHRQVEVTRVGCDESGVIDPAEVDSAVKSNTRLIALVHVSNVTGAVQPVEEVGAIARQRGVLFLVDAAQSLGHLPVDIGRIGAHLLAAPGHKGLLSPLGVGLLVVAKVVDERLQPLRQGGTGTSSDVDRQPDSLPDKYESGNLNVTGIVGLGAGLTYLAERGIDAVCRHDRQLTERLLAQFENIEGVTVFGPRDVERRVGVVSVCVEGYDPREAAALLDSAYSIQVRPGIHCAPLMHRALNTVDGGGTIRFSLGPFTTTDEVDAAGQAIGEIAATMKV